MIMGRGAYRWLLGGGQAARRAGLDLVSCRTVIAFRTRGQALPGGHEEDGGGRAGYTDDRTVTCGLGIG